MIAFKRFTIQWYYYIMESNDNAVSRSRSSTYIVNLGLFFKFYLFIYFWLRWVFVAACRLSLVAARGGYFLLWCAGFSLQWLLLLLSTGSRHTGFSSCGLRAQQLWLTGSRTQAQQLWCTGLVALWDVGSSRIRARTRVPCIGRGILNHCATREVPIWGFQDKFLCCRKVQVLKSNTIESAQQ